MTKDKYDDEAAKLLPCSYSLNHDCGAVICSHCRAAVAARLRELGAEIERLEAHEQDLLRLSGDSEMLKP